MARSLSLLLPEPDEALRCAEHARLITVDPGGTAIRADRIVVVEVPLPWPKPALDHPLLSGMREVFASSAVPTRLLAAVPAKRALSSASARSRGDALSISVTLYQRAGASALERHFEASTVDDLVAIARTIDDPSATGGLHEIGEAQPARQAVLLCVQGSHDVCCGSEGVRLADELASDPDLIVHRVSHTGGHRFAPTGLTMPDGRMWAALDTEAVSRIMNADGDPAALAQRCRGWWGAETGAAQVAERAVFAREGWAFNGQDRSVAVEPTPGEGQNGETTLVTISSPLGTWLVEVVEGRAVPSIACRQPGGLPAKPAREYDVVSLSQR